MNASDKSQVAPRLSARGATLAGLTSPEIGRIAAGTVLVVPIGSTEQHGPHLPLSTDTDIAVGISAALGRRRDDVVIAAAVAYGSSGEHAAFPGTVSVGQEAVELFLVELGRSASETFPRILFICAHGGNHQPVTRAEQRLRAEERDVVAFLPDWRLDAHAGRAETALMLAIAPDDVKLDLAEAGATESLSELMPQLVDEGVRAVSRNGVLGDPGGASVEEGERLLEGALAELDDLLDRWPSPV